MFTLSPDGVPETSVRAMSPIAKEVAYSGDRVEFHILQGTDSNDPKEEH